MKTIILLFVALLSITITFAQKKFKTDSGFVFIDGKYIEPPYKLEVKGNAIYINNIKIKESKIYTKNDFKAFKHDPGIPPNLNENSSIDDIFAKDSITGISYLSLKAYYLFYNYEDSLARVKIRDYIKSLPNVKSYEGFKVQTFNGEKGNISYDIGIPSTLRIMQTPKHEIVDKLEKKTDKFYNDLNQNKALFFFPSDNDYYSKTSNQIIAFINKMDSLINDTISSIDLKVKKYSVEYSNEMYLIKKLINKYQVSDNLKIRLKKISAITGYIYNKCKNINKVDNISNLNSVNKSVNSANIAYSPKSSTVVFGCAYTKEGAFVGYEDEVDVLVNELVDKYGYTFNQYFDETPFDNSYGSLTYESIQNMGTADIVYWASHGSPSYDLDGIELIRLPSEQAINFWTTGSFSEIDPFVAAIKYSETQWGALAGKSWFQQYWNNNLTLSNSIIFLSSCFSYENGCAAACGGGVAFGYNIETSGADCADNTEGILQNMNGTINYGLYRTAEEAYNHIPHLREFSKVSNTQVTICPSVSDYNIFYQSDVPNYIEFDTWCDANVNISEVVELTSGNAFLSNLHWVDDDLDGKSNKIEFLINGCGSFTAGITVHNDKIKSWSNGGTGHINDFDRVEPAEATTYYAITGGYKSAMSVSFTADNTNIPQGTSVQFNASINGSNVAYTWSFPGGIPSTSNSQSPIIFYPTPGNFDVSLVASNTEQCSQLTETDYINVNQNNEINTNDYHIYCYHWNNSNNYVVVFFDFWELPPDFVGGYDITFVPGRNLPPLSTHNNSLSTAQISYYYPSEGVYNYEVYVTFKDIYGNYYSSSCSDEVIIGSEIYPCDDLDISISGTPVAMNQNTEITINITGGSGDFFFTTEQYGYISYVRIYNPNNLLFYSNNRSYLNSFTEIVKFPMAGTFKVEVEVYDLCGAHKFEYYDINVPDVTNCIQAGVLPGSSLQWNANNILESLTPGYLIENNVVIVNANKPTAFYNTSTFSTSCSNARVTDLTWILYYYNYPFLSTNGSKTLIQMYSEPTHYDGYGVFCRNFTFPKAGVYQLVIRAYDRNHNPFLNNYGLYYDESYALITVDDCSSDIYECFDNPSPLPDGSLFSGTHNPVRANNIIIGGSCNANVMSGATIKYAASNEITLEDGFTAEDGSDFTAFIFPCMVNYNDNCNSAKSHETIDSLTLLTRIDTIVKIKDYNKAEINNNDYEILKFTAFPNPVIEKTFLNFEIPDTLDIEINIFDLFGKNIGCILKGKFIPGEYVVTFTPVNLSSGVYFAVLNDKNKNILKTLKLIIQSNI